MEKKSLIPLGNKRLLPELLNKQTNKRCICSSIFLGEFEHLTATPNNRHGELAHGSKGFRFGYNQAKCSEKECFQCKMLGDWYKEPINYEFSCQGPHFTKGTHKPFPSERIHKIYQPYNGPSIRKYILIEHAIFVSI